MKKILFLMGGLLIGTFLFSQDQTINGNLTVNSLLRIGKATDVDNKSPGIVGGYNNFLYKGKYINHYGFGFYAPNTDIHTRSYISDFWGIDFFTEGKHRLTIERNGNIGIGTENPIAKLDVNGTIRSKEVKIEATGWADFVFNKDYKLPSLKDVEKHIGEKGTLPDIPSEQEVKENGVDIGDMQVKLLQKIEELTLYVIEQEKAIKALKEENKELRSSVQPLLSKENIQ